jgi:hypothetical protein
MRFSCAGLDEHGIDVLIVAVLRSSRCGDLAGTFTARDRARFVRAKRVKRFPTISALPLTKAALCCSSIDAGSAPLRLHPLAHGGNEQ